MFYEKKTPLNPVLIYFVLQSRQTTYGAGRQSCGTDRKWPGVETVAHPPVWRLVEVHKSEQQRRDDSSAGEPVR